MATPSAPIMATDHIHEEGRAVVNSVPYSIHSFSSFSGNFRPSNIIVDKPKDSTSRWSGGLSLSTASSEARYGEGIVSTAPMSAWVMLELSKPSIISSITFGKHHESHPCNPQSVTILAGLSPLHLREIYSGRLKNDTTPETKDVTWKVKLGGVEIDKRGVWQANERSGDGGNIAFAVRYIKILPGPAYEARFNASIWHVAVNGISSETVVTKVQRRYLQAQSLQANRVALKYLRSSQMAPAYNALYELMMSNPNTPRPLLEHPLLTELHHAIVEQGDYDRAEEIIQEILDEGLMDDHIARGPVKYRWQTIEPRPHADGMLQEPPRRGGHALCMDESSRVWMFGGWDGSKEMDDLWVRVPRIGGVNFAEDGAVWRKVERKEDAAWPEARAGCAMTVSGNTLYLMGAGESRLDGTVVSSAPATGSIISTGDTRSSATDHSTPQESFGLVSEDLTDVVEKGMPEVAFCGLDRVWAFDIEKEEWSVIDDVDVVNLETDRPGIMEVKNMCVRGSQLYVYGMTGRLAAARGRLYTLNLETKAWSRLHSIPTADQPANSTSPAQLALFDTSDASLLLLDGGSTSPTLPAQLWRNILPTNQLYRLQSLGRQCPPLKPGNPVRGFYDEIHSDIVVIFGHGKGCILPKLGRTSQIWRYSVRLAEWFPVIDATEENERRTARAVTLDYEVEELQPTKKEGTPLDLAFLQRCGHELVYNPAQDACLIIGSSTPANSDQANDYRMITFDRPGKATIRRKCLLAIRKQKFIDMVSNSPSMQALHYLQGPLHAVVDHDAADESKHFRALLAHLLQFGSTVESMPEGELVPETDQTVSSEQHSQRTGVFEAILRYVSPRYKQPAGDLLHSAQDM